MTDEQIKYMTNRFLSWPLPASFSPDGGISFDPVANKGSPYEHQRCPVGTNLLDFDQAQAMVRAMVDGLPE